MHIFIPLADVLVTAIIILIDVAVITGQTMEMARVPVILLNRYIDEMKMPLLYS